MNALVAKETRLLLPAYGMALVLAVVPVWLLPRDLSVVPSEVALYPFGFGAVMLALSSFGREFGLQTFPLILAQPLERTRIWRTKTAVLAGALATTLAAWCLSLAAYAYLGPGWSNWHEPLATGATATAVAFAGGLWTTLLLRQVGAAFWFTILVPAVVLAVIANSGGTDLMIVMTLGLYSVAGFFWARRQFFRAQETAWTGGVVLFPDWRAADAGSRSSVRARRPLAALVRKELQLHQVGLMGMGGLFLLHLGVVALLVAGHDTLGDTTRSALGLFGGIWLIVPLLAGTPSVAEERKLGTMDGHLCLPISTRVQFAIKLLAVLVVGGLLSAVLLWTAEGIGGTLGADSGMFLRPAFGGQSLAMLFLLSLGLALIGFYASTVARNTVQALAAAVVTAIGLMVIVATAFNPNPREVLGLWLWRGNLVHYLAWPTLAVTFIWLAYRNFTSGSERWHFWRRNALGLTGALLFIIGSTSVLYHRAWELFLPLEPAHGPARLVGPAPTSVDAYGSALTVRLPDRRVWADSIRYEPGQLFLEFGQDTGIRVGGKWRSQSSHPFLPGSNWAAAVSSYRGTVGIRSDGTLWVSETPRARWDGKGRPPVLELVQPVQFGSETNWQNVVREYPWSVLLLKQDGTLWRWGTNSFSDRMEWPGLQAFQPQRLGTASDWARILRGIDCIYAWERDRHAWAIHAPERKPKNQETELEPGTVVERCSYLDDFKLQSLARYGKHEVSVREDGTLWVWPRHLWSKARRTQMGRDTDWVAVAGDHEMLVALKKDGSLWKWDDRDAFGPQFSLPPASLVRLGTHRDWVAVGAMIDGIVSLAADGSLWHWSSPSRFYYPRASDQPLLAGSRKPAKIENIFAGQE